MQFRDVTNNCPIKQKQQQNKIRIHRPQETAIDEYTVNR